MDEVFCQTCGTVTVHVDTDDVGFLCTACNYIEGQEEEFVSLDEMVDEELKDNDYVEGIDNWEDWN